jgi:hypothetical protein
MVLRRTARVAWLLGVAALLAACSGIPLKEREHAERARVESYAGEPLRHFTWFGRFDGWKPLGRDEALVWTTPRKAYLVRVDATCDDLRFAHRIGLTSTLSSVYSRYDYVEVRGRPCRIEEIRPVDYARLQADLRHERESRQANVATRHGEN